MPKQR